MVKMFLNRDKLTYGNFYVMWDYIKSPHILIFGKTGCGKTYALMLLLARLSLCIKNCVLFILDYKAQDFLFLQGCKNYYVFESCFKGIEEVYSRFIARQSGQDTSRNFIGLVFDEYASFINMLDKKQSEEVKRKVSTILMLGRSFNIHVIFSLQRPDAEYFAKARDNFNVIVGLGTLSKEAKNMFFSDYIDDIKQLQSRGTGWWLDDNGLYPIVVPAISDMRKVENYIRKSTDR